MEATRLLTEQNLSACGQLIVNLTLHVLVVPVIDLKKIIQAIAIKGRSRSRIKTLVQATLQPQAVE